jgi:hypothetical protein
MPIADLDSNTTKETIAGIATCSPTTALSELALMRRRFRSVRKVVLRMVDEANFVQARY